MCEGLVIDDGNGGAALVQAAQVAPGSSDLRRARGRRRLGHPERFRAGLRHQRVSRQRTGELHQHGERPVFLLVLLAGEPVDQYLDLSGDRPGGAPGRVGADLRPGLALPGPRAGQPERGEALGVTRRRLRPGLPRRDPRGPVERRRWELGRGWFRIRQYGHDDSGSTWRLVVPDRIYADSRRLRSELEQPSKTTPPTSASSRSRAGERHGPGIDRRCWCRAEHHDDHDAVPRPGRKQRGGASTLALSDTAHGHGAGGDPALPIIVVAVLIALLGGAAWLRWRRRPGEEPGEG